MKVIFLARNSARNFQNNLNTLRLSIGFTGFISLLTPSTYAAGTTLTAGDLAFTMIASDPAAAVNPNTVSKFSFVTFVDLVVGTVINFTDVGADSAGVFRSNTSPNEAYFTYTTTSAVAAGKQVTITTTGTTAVATATFGTISVSNPWSGTEGSITNNNGFYLDGFGSSTSAGDQVFAFQGTATSPTFIAGITTDVDNGGTYSSTTGWGSNNTSILGSALPSALTAGTNALSLSSTKSGGVYTAGTERYSAYVANLSGTKTKEAWLDYLNDSANWTSGAGGNASTLLLISAIPEPGSYALLAGFGALGGVLVRRRRSRG